MKVIKFYADWCGPCRTYAPTFSEWAEENPDIETVEVDVQDGWEGAREYGISAIPATVVISDDEPIVKLGVLTKEQLNDISNGIL